MKNTTLVPQRKILPSGSWKTLFFYYFCQKFVCLTKFCQLLYRIFDFSFLKILASLILPSLVPDTDTCKFTYKIRFFHYFGTKFVFLPNFARCYRVFLISIFLKFSHHLFCHHLFQTLILANLLRKFDFFTILAQNSFFWISPFRIQ